MNLKSRVAAHLRSGSVNVPGRNAVNVIASRLSCKESEVRSALTELMAEGNLDLGGGTTTYTSYIALTDRTFRPRTEEGRRQHKHAVDQLGRHYRGVATGGPVITRQATLEEWVRMGNNASTYKFGTPANEITQEATSIMDEPVPSNASPDVDAVYAELAKNVDKQPKVRKARKAPAKAVVKKAPRDTVVSRRRLENIEKLKQLISEQAANTEGGSIPTNDFKASAAKILCVSESAVQDYMTDLVKSKFIERGKSEFRGKSYFKLTQKLDFEQRLNLTLEVLRELKRKRSRSPLKEEVAAKLKCVPDVAEASYLNALRIVGGYRTEKQQTGRLITFKLVFVQDGPVTADQLEAIRKKRREQKRVQMENLAAKQGTEELTPQVNDDVAQPSQPAALALQAVAVSDQDEITALLSGLIETNEAQAARIVQLEEALTHKEDALAHQIDVNSSFERRMAELGLQLDSASIMLEAERVRAETPLPTSQPAVPADLLNRARAIVNKEPSSVTS